VLEQRILSITNTAGALKQKKREFFLQKITSFNFFVTFNDYYMLIQKIVNAFLE